MTTERTLPSLNLALLCLCLIATIGAAQVPGTSREQMWFAPTAEDWKKPCLLHWQRSWEDAVAVSKETGKAILVCINMDGEIASEHYAGVRYRQPDIASLYKPYVCVIASVYRHTPRDYDEHGHRIECPRFGGVTCGEHIAIEPFLFEKFMDGQRVAPRHIMVELDGKETYDVFYAFDTDSVFKAIGDGISSRPQGLLKNVVRGDRSIIERVAGRDSADRNAVEKAYKEGDKELQRALLEAARSQGNGVPVELLRLAINGFDVDLAQAALQALSQSDSKKAVDLIADAMRVPMGDKERKDLITALGRLGKADERARTLSVVHQGLSGGSGAVDVGVWSKAMAAGSSYAPAPSSDAVASTLETQDDVFGSADANKHVELAEAFLERALQSGRDGRSARALIDALFQDAKDAAIKAEQLGASGWRVSAAIAVASWYLGESEQALQRAETAVSGMPANPQSWNAMIVLGLFVDARRKAIEEAVKAKNKWPGNWLTDVHSAYAILAVHPHGDDAQVAAHIDFLWWLGAKGKAGAALDAGLGRWPDSWRLHQRLRGRVLDEKGYKHLEAAYEAMLARKPTGDDAPTNLEWFAGFATMTAAEFHRKAGDDTQAHDAYTRGITHFEKSIEVNAEITASAEHYIAMALGAQGRIAMEANDHERAVGLVVASFDRKDSAANALDGLNLSTADTAKMLLARLKEADKTALAAKLDARMKKLDPKLLELPAYEFGGPSNNRGNRGNRGSQNRRGNRRQNQTARSLLRYDKDADGRVHGTELPSILRKRLLDRYDKNKNGVIDAAEMNAPTTSGGQ